MKNDDKQYKKIEAMLHNYNQTKAEIKNLKLDLEILENDYKGTRAISYEERSCPTNKFNSDVENEVIKRDESIIKLRNKIRLKEIEIQKIDNAMITLNKDEKLIVNERYFNKRTNKYIAATLNVTEQTSCDYKFKLINKLIPLLISD